MKFEDKDIIDYRVTSDSPFIGLLISCNWDSKDEVRKLLLDNQEAKDNYNPAINQELLDKLDKIIEEKEEEIKSLRIKNVIKIDTIN